MPSFIFIIYQLLLLLNLTIIVQPVRGINYSCPSIDAIPDCSCKTLDRTDDIQLSCVNSSHVVTIKRPRFVTIGCTPESEWSRFLNDTRLELGSAINFLILEACRPIGADDLEVIEDRLGIVIEALKYEYLPSVLRSSDLEIFSSIIHLELDGNQLFDVDDDLLIGLPNLKYVSLQNTGVTPSLGFFNGSSKLETIKLNSNGIRELKSGTFDVTKHLIEIDLSANELRELAPLVFRGLNSLEKLILDDNNLQSLPVLLLANALVLRKLSVSRNNITSLPDDFFKTTEKLKILDLSHNRLISIDETTFKGLFTLEELNLQHNDLTFIHHEAFFDLNQLKVAKFSNNRLTMRFNLEDVNSRISPLHYNLDLQELYLANNNVSELFDDWILLFAKLRKLDLTNNSVSELRAEELQFTSNHLEVNLSNNKIRAIELSELDEIATAHLTLHQRQQRDVRVILQGNPIECDYRLHPLLRYLAENENTTIRRFVQLDVKGLRCWGPDRARGKEIVTTDFFCSNISSSNLTLQCVCEAYNQTIYDYVKSHIKILAISLSLTCLLLIIVLLLVFHYRESIKFWLYAHNMCLFFAPNDNANNNKRFDAFVSYSHKDRRFVWNELVAKLESGPRPYKLCIHERDWPAGCRTTDQIKRSVLDSRRTIIVLSSNFFNSYWSRYEFKVACDQNQATIIMLLIDEELGNITELEACLGTQDRCIKLGDPWFWHKLRYAMPRPRQG